MTIDIDDFEWMLGTPAGDVNFRSHFEKANLETLRAVRDALQDRPFVKVKLGKIEARIRRLEREQ